MGSSSIFVRFGIKVGILCGSLIFLILSCDTKKQDEKDSSNNNQVVSPAESHASTLNFDSKITINSLESLPSIIPSTLGDMIDSCRLARLSVTDSGSSKPSGTSPRSIVANISSRENNLQRLSFKKSLIISAIFGVRK